MKKMKKMIAVLASTVVALLPIFIFSLYYRTLELKNNLVGEMVTLKKFFCHKKVFPTIHPPLLSQ